MTAARQSHSWEADVQWARIGGKPYQGPESERKPPRSGADRSGADRSEADRSDPRRSDPHRSAADRAREVAGAVVDPELPYLTLDDLGVIGDIDVSGAGRVRVTVTPTFLGCPATAVIQRDIVTALRGHGWADAEVELVFQPPWTPDRITDRGRAKLAAEGYGIPARLGAGPAGAGPVPVTIGAAPPMACPQCGAADTAVLSRFGATPCQEVRRCTACGEPFPALRPVHPAGRPATATATSAPAPAASGPTAATTTHPARTSGSRTA